MALALDAVGRVLGRAAEAGFRARHLQRLRRTGHLAPGAPVTALTGHSFPLRQGNQVEPLVDGQDAFASMAAAIAGARRSILLTGWSADARFRMAGADEPEPTLGGLLAQAGARGVTSRVLLWAGAPLPVIHPSRHDARASAAGFAALEGVRCVLDAREYALDCHHEKVLVVDDEVAFVGGLDLTAQQSDRWDTTEHRPRPVDGWHDAAIRLTGPVVADVVHHVAQRWAAVAGERLDPPPTPAPTGPVPVRLVRTVPERVYDFAPEGDFDALAAYLEALRSARSLIYLENQFLWAVEVVDVLVDLLRHPPGEDFRLVVLLPARAHTGQDATLGQLTRLREADRDGRLLAVVALSASPDHAVYVHAKIGVVDDRWLTIGSANLNTHSMFNDTEVNVVVEDPDVARRTRERLWLEHTGQDGCGMPPHAFVDDVLRPLAQEQSRRVERGLAPTGRVRLMDDVGPRSDLLLGPLVSLVVDS